MKLLIHAQTSTAAPLKFGNYLLSEIPMLSWCQVCRYWWHCRLPHERYLNHSQPYDNYGATIADNARIMITLGFQRWRYPSWLTRFLHLSSNSDNAFLYSGIEGIANTFQACSDLSFSIIKLYPQDLKHQVALLSHEMGHLVGVYHDGKPKGPIHFSQRPCHIKAETNGHHFVNDA